jgi:hypothetical protein
MLIRESETRLASLLAEAGVTPGAVTVVDVRATVEAFRRFASITVDDSAPAHEDGDGSSPSSGPTTLPGWAWALRGSQAPRDLVITFDEV